MRAWMSARASARHSSLGNIVCFHLSLWTFSFIQRRVVLLTPAVSCLFSILTQFHCVRFFYLVDRFFICCCKYARALCKCHGYNFIVILYIFFCCFLQTSQNSQINYSLISMFTFVYYISAIWMQMHKTQQHTQELFVEEAAIERTE